MYRSAYDLYEDIKDFETSKYFHYWKTMLQTLFGLPQQSIYEWATYYRKELFAKRSEHPRYDHPLDAIKHLFVTRDLLKNRSFQYFPFLKELTEQIDTLGTFDEINYDYDAAKQIVISQLEKRHAELPRITNDNLITRDQLSRLLAEEKLSVYIPFYKNYFREILCINEQCGRYWLLRKQKRLADGRIIPYRDGPAYDVLDLTTPDELVYRLDINWFDYRDQLYDIIDDNGNCRTSNYDFAKVKKRLTDFFSQYDTKINQPRAIAMVDGAYLTTKHCAPFVLRFMANLLCEALGWSWQQVLEKAKSAFRELHVKCPCLIQQTYTQIFFKNAGPRCTESILYEEIFGSEIPDSAKAQKLYWQIQKAIADASGERGRPVYEPDYDFVKVGKKIRSLIKQYE